MPQETNTQSVQATRRLTENQLANWRNLFPELRLFSDSMIEQFRNVIEKRVGDLSPKGSSTATLTTKEKKVTEDL